MFNDRELENIDLMNSLGWFMCFGDGNGCNTHGDPYWDGSSALCEEATNRINMARVGVLWERENSKALKILEEVLSELKVVVSENNSDILSAIVEKAEERLKG